MIDELLQGNEKFLADEFRPHADYYHAIADWLCIATGAKETADRITRERNLSREEKLAVLTEENVKLQIKHLRNLALIRNMHAQGATADPRLALPGRDRNDRRAGGRPCCPHGVSQALTACAGHTPSRPGRRSDARG